MNVSPLDPAIVVLVAAFLPLVISVINRPAWPSNVKSLIAFVITMLVGLAVAWFIDQFDRQGIIVVEAAVYGLSQVAEGSLWKPTGVSGNIEKST